MLHSSSQSQFQSQTLLVGVTTNNLQQVINVLNHKNSNLDLEQLYTVSNTAQTLLMIAAANGNVEIARLLLRNEAKIATTNSEGNTALMFAAQAGQSEILPTLSNTEIINYVNKQGNSALNIALAEFQEECALKLLDSGANIKAIEHSSSNTALHFAESRKLNNLVGKLVATASSVDDLVRRNGEGNTALTSAIKNKNIDFAEKLITAAKSKFLDVRPLVNMPDAEGNTPLILAAKFKFTELAKKLINYGANIEAKNTGGFDAYEYAYEANDNELAQIIKGKKMEASEIVTIKQSGLYPQIQSNAATTAQSELARLKNMISSAQNPDLHKAIMNSSDNQVWLRMQDLSNSALCSKNSLGQTPLTIAVIYGKFTIACSLLDKLEEKNLSAEILMLKDSQTKTPRDYANEFGNEKMQSLFR